MPVICNIFHGHSCNHFSINCKEMLVVKVNRDYETDTTMTGLNLNRDLYKNYNFNGRGNETSSPNFNSLIY